MVLEAQKDMVWLMQMLTAMIEEPLIVPSGEDLYSYSLNGDRLGSLTREVGDEIASQRYQLFRGRLMVGQLILIQLMEVQYLPSKKVYGISERRIGNPPPDVGLKC